MHVCPRIPDDEEARLATLRRYRILDTEPEAQFDRIVQLAKRQFDVPMAFLTLVDRDRAFLKARDPGNIVELPRDISFCGHTILQRDVMVVEDTLKDDRFRDNPLVVGDPKFRFYAGVTLVSGFGHALGTVCVFDTRPRTLSSEDIAILADLGAIATDHLEMRLAVSSVHDEVEVRRTAEISARHAASHDALTGLPNRFGLTQFAARVRQNQVKGPSFALYADLDRFKEANDTLGHHAGDQILLKAAVILRTRLGPDAFIARISGDEFVALVGGVSKPDLGAAAELIVSQLGEPMPLLDRMFSPGISIGVAAAETGEDVDHLLQRADLALSAAKRAGGHGVTWHDAAMADQAKRRRRLAADIGAAVATRQIAVHYQTIHEASNGAVIGVEALARWRHEVYGDIPAAEFIAIAEESRAIVGLGELVLQQAVEAASHWPDQFVAVNLSPAQFRIPDLPERLISIVRAGGLAPGRVQFEVTEGMLVEDIDRARHQIAALQAYGIRVALDDFGTGYSSLSYLSSIPFNKLKIDRSFVRSFEENHTDAAIIRHIVSLAHHLHMRVTAEGVETEQQARLLALAGCDSFQGYRFSRPVPAGLLGPLLTRSVAAA